MSLKDRLTKSKNTQAEKPQEKDFSEFNISVLKILDLIKTVESPEKLGLIVKEIARFLENFATEDMTVNISGDLDCGKQALLGCLLAGVTEEKTTSLQEFEEIEEIQNLEIEEQQDDAPKPSEPVVSEEKQEEAQTEEPPMVKKRRTLRQKLKGM